MTFSQRAELRQQMMGLVNEADIGASDRRDVGVRQGRGAARRPT
jgi:hypothetical protein